MLDDKKIYLTKNGLKRVKKEYNALKKLKFRRINEKSDNFLCSKRSDSKLFFSLEDLNFFRKRMIELGNILKNNELIKKPAKQKRKMIGLGAKVTLKEKSGQETEVVIVETLKSNPDEGKVSLQSPIGKSLFGRLVGDKVAMDFLNGEIYKIIKVKY